MELSGKKVVLTGATGYLGRAIVEMLLKKGCRVRCLVRNYMAAKQVFDDRVEVVEYDLDNTQKLRAVLSGFEVVIHCAAVHHRKYYDAEALLRVNVEGTRHVIQALGSIDAFVHISSIRSIMNEHVSVIDENTNYDYSKHDSPYGFSKYQAEKICLEYFNSNEFPLFILNPAPIIGPNDNGPSLNGKMILDHIGRKIEFFTDALWPIVDVRDVANAVAFVMEKGRMGERHVLCSDTLRLRDFYGLIDELSNQKKIYIRVPHDCLELAGRAFEILEKIYPKFDPPITPSGVNTVRLMTSFSGDKMRRMGFVYRSPRETLQDAVQWFLRTLD